MIDVDVANLRRFLRGDFNGMFPVDTAYALSNGGSGLTNSAIPQNQGWVLYVSDRRGDADFDGEFDMEDVYGSGKGNDNVKQPGEDFNGTAYSYLYGTEQNVITPTRPTNFAAVSDHKYFRRGVADKRHRIAETTILKCL